jgi:lipoprotein-anchoring transpeptidase ErfK/SrfK
MNKRGFVKTLLGAAVSTSSMSTVLRTPASAMRDLDEPFQIAFGDSRKLRRKYRKQEVKIETNEPLGTIIVDPRGKFLYFVLENGRALRYGIGVGRQGFEWSGRAVIRRKAKWPRWTPPKDMVARDKFAAKWADGMPGGPDNPLGARALYLFQGKVDTLYRIHGTSQPETIGRAVSSGCIRMINADVADLYERARIGSNVVVLSGTMRVADEPIERPRKYLFDFIR